MVASAKVRRAQDALAAAREFTKGVTDLFPEVSWEYGHAQWRAIEGAGSRMGCRKPACADRSFVFSILRCAILGDS